MALTAGTAGTGGTEGLDDPTVQGKGGGKKGGKGKAKTKTTKPKNVPDVEVAPTIPKSNKKIGSKITSLSSKLTEIRCLQTQVENAKLYLIVIQKIFPLFYSIVRK